MKQSIEKKSILEMSMGAILERVDYEMGRVLENIIDPNTKATAARSITVTLKIVPAADRKTITVQTQAKSALCPTEPVTTSLFVTQQSGGEMVVAEMTPQIPGQYSLDGTEQESPKVLKFTNMQKAAIGG